jgi:hypothetical protein
VAQGASDWAEPYRGATRSNVILPSNAMRCCESAWDLPLILIDVQGRPITPFQKEAGSRSLPRLTIALAAPGREKRMVLAGIRSCPRGPSRSSEHPLERFSRCYRPPRSRHPLLPRAGPRRWNWAHTLSHAFHSQRLAVRGGSMRVIGGNLGQPSGGARASVSCPSDGSAACPKSGIEEETPKPG